MCVFDMCVGPRKDLMRAAVPHASRARLPPRCVFLPVRCPVVLARVLCARQRVARRWPVAAALTCVRRRDVGGGR